MAEPTAGSIFKPGFDPDDPLGTNLKPTPTPRPTPAPKGRFSMMDKMNEALSQAFKFNRPAASMPQDPLSAALRAPVRLAGLPFLAQRSMSTDNPGSQSTSIFQLAKPPSQIPLNQLPPSPGEVEMSNWYDDLINRFSARPDVGAQQSFQF